MRDGSVSRAGWGRSDLYLITVAPRGIRHLYCTWRRSRVLSVGSKVRADCPLALGSVVLQALIAQSILQSHICKKGQKRFKPFLSCTCPPTKAPADHHIQDVQRTQGITKRVKEIYVWDPLYIKTGSACLKNSMGVWIYMKVFFYSIWRLPSLVHLLKTAVPMVRGTSVIVIHR